MCRPIPVWRLLRPRVSSGQFCLALESNLVLLMPLSHVIVQRCNMCDCLMLVWHLHDFWPRICRGKSCHFWDTNWEATALFTTSSCIVHEEFKTSTRMRANQCPHWHELARRVHAWFAHSLRIVYVLPALARRVCAIRTVSYRLGHAI